jgi:hypothetical protein
MLQHAQTSRVLSTMDAEYQTGWAVTGEVFSEHKPLWELAILPQALWAGEASNFFCDLMAAESLWCGGKEAERAKRIGMFHRFAFDRVATGAPWRGKRFLLDI